MSTAEDLEKQAKKHTRKFLFNLLGDSSEEAQELYNQAGNKYKQLHQWKDACRCYYEAAKLSEKNNDDIFLATNLVELSNCMKKMNPTSNDFVDPLLRATEVYSNQGRFSQTGRILKNLAENFEEKLDYESAMKFYKKSAESYELDEYGKVSGSQVLLKYADLASSITDSYEECIQIYEEEGQKNLKNDLLKFGVKDLLFKAGVLRVLSADATDARIAFGKYCSWDRKFGKTREGKLLSSLIEAFEAGDFSKLQDELNVFESLGRLDNWKIKVLCKLKEKMEGASTASGPINDSDHVDLT
uniref:SNAP protein, putative n=1 Tax=Theileria annulata TaxID=5874 RepID=A0A3B0MLW6_THEAN